MSAIVASMPQGKLCFFCVFLRCVSLFTLINIEWSWTHTGTLTSSLFVIASVVSSSRNVRKTYTIVLSLSLSINHWCAPVKIEHSARRFSRDNLLVEHASLRWPGACCPIINTSEGIKRLFLYQECNCTRVVSVYLWIGAWRRQQTNMELIFLLCATVLCQVMWSRRVHFIVPCPF